ncbi:short transient receptor potential channel 4-like, partial [Paramuricea clavata]
MLIGFLASELLWFIGGWPVDKLESASDVPGHRILLLANSLFSISTVLSVFYLGSFWTVHSMGGSLQISSLRMLKDIRNFSVIFFGVFVAFTLGVWNIYSFRNTLEAIYPNGNGTAQRVEDDISTFSQSWQALFWALFDQTNVKNFEIANPRFGITSKTGKLMFAIYLISVVLVGMNLLIAMMNNSYEYVANDKTALNWTMDKTALWLEFAQKDDYILPPPYCILQIVIYVCDRLK